MSEQEQSNVEDQQENQQENQDQQQQQQDDDDDNDDDDQDDEEDDEQQNQDDEEDQQDGQQQQDQQQQSSNQQKLPTFKPVQQFKFTSILSELSHLSNSVDSFIHTLPSYGGTTNTQYRSTQSYHRPLEIQTYKSTFPIPQQKIIMMKDQDTQVTMQPQIVINSTIKQQKKKQPYKISNTSTKFLQQLYQQNKKLKRWQNVGDTRTSAYMNSRDRFERKQEEKGLFNVEDRNRQIDEAIEMLRNEQ